MRNLGLGDLGFLGAVGGVERDPFFANVSLLLHGDGANGSTTIIDSSPSPKTVTAAGDAKISTAQSKFGTGSILLNGAGDYLVANMGTTNPTNFETGDFTVEFWMYYTGVSSGFGGHIIDLRTGSTNGSHVYYVNNGRLYYTDDNNFGDLDTSISVPTNIWKHYAICCSSGILQAFGGGSLGYSVNYTKSLPGQTTVFVGVRYTTVSFLPGYLSGYIDELRITKGVARYTSNFTPPSAPFPDA